MWPGRWPGALTTKIVPSPKRSIVCSKGGRGREDHVRIRGVSVPTSDLRGSGLVESSTGFAVGDGCGSSIVRSRGKRSGSKNECDPMLSCVLPDSKSKAPGPTMNFVGGPKSFGRPT